MNPKQSDTVEKELTYRQKRAIPFIAAARSIDSGCKDAEVSDATFYAWNANPAFRRELQNARDQIMRESMETIKANVGRAAQELVELLNAKSPEVRRRAATDLINFALKWKDSVELAERLESVETLVMERRFFR